MDLEKRIMNAEDTRRKALQSGDAVKYARLCSELGIEPENPDLYSMGEAELIRQEQIKQERIERNERQFLALASPYSKINMFAYPMKKRALLQTYFPDRFGTGGIQPLKRTIDSDVCKIFSKVYATYENKYKK